MSTTMQLSGTEYAALRTAMADAKEWTLAKSDREQERVDREAVLAAAKNQYSENPDPTIPSPAVVFLRQLFRRNGGAA